MSEISEEQINAYWSTVPDANKITMMKVMGAAIRAVMDYGELGYLPYLLITPLAVRMYQDDPERWHNEPLAIMDELWPPDDGPPPEYYHEHGMLHPDEEEEDDLLGRVTKLEACVEALKAPDKEDDHDRHR